MRATVPTVPMGVDAFLAWEERQPERFELVGAVVRLMAGGTEGHDRISGNGSPTCAAGCAARPARRTSRTSRW